MKLWFSLIFIILLSFIAAYQFVESPPPQTFTIATGREGGAYHRFALQYQQQLAKEGVNIEVQPTAGSVAALKLLQAGDVEIALVQGGTASELESVDGLESLACLFYEPVWLFHRRGYPLNYLSDLRGQRVNIGELGSGTRPLALQLLKDNGITAENTTFIEVSHKEGAQQLKDGKIEAAFFVMSPSSELILELVRHPELELLTFKRHLAYTHRYSYLASLKLGEGMFDLEHNIPAQDKTLLSTTASLVTHSDLHPDMIRLLLREAIKIHGPGGFLEHKGDFPNEKYVELPMNSIASQYLQHGPSWLESLFPFWLASKLERLKIMLIPIIFLLIPLLKGIIPLYNWQIRYKVFRWYGELRKIEQEIPQIHEPQRIEQEIKQLKNLQHELIEVVSVPLSFMWELYLLRMHITFLLERLEEHLILLKKGGEIEGS